MNFGRGCRSPWPWLLVSILFASGCATHYASTLHFRARFETDNYAIAIEEFRKDVGQYPEQARGLKALLEGSEIAAWKGPYLSRIDRDPWGRPFGYRIPSTGGDRPFDVYSLGRNGFDEQCLGDDICNGRDPSWFEYEFERVWPNYLATVAGLLVTSYAAVRLLRRRSTTNSRDA